MPEIVRCGTYYFHLNVLTDFFFFFFFFFFHFYVYILHTAVCVNMGIDCMYMCECIKGIGRYMNRCAHYLFMHPVT